MGDLVVGARSGSGEPEKGEVHVPSVDGSEADGVVPATGGSDGVGRGAPPEAGYAGDGTAGSVGHGAGSGPEAGAGPEAKGFDPGFAGAPSVRPEEIGGLNGGVNGVSGSGGHGPEGAHRPDPDGPDGPGGSGPEGDSSEEPAPARSQQQRSFWKELPMLIGIALVLALLIKTFLVQAFSIPSDSMQNTLQVGDRVLVDKLTPWFGSTPTRGEVVVFHDPGGWLPENPPPSSDPIVRGLQKGLSFIGLMPSAEEKDLIKRVIGVGGDTVSCKGTGPVMVNGKALDEPYVFPGNTACSPDMPFTVHVPKGRIWVMGDHRQDSLDSRFHMDKPGGGTVSDKQVVGRAIMVAWPVNRWDWLGIPGTFSQPGINAAGGAVPVAAGLAGAVPLVLVRRRRLLRTDPASVVAEGPES